jgi:hypothetical protein
MFGRLHHESRAGTGEEDAVLREPADDRVNDRCT